MNLNDVEYMNFFCEEINMYLTWVFFQTEIGSELKTLDNSFTSLMGSLGISEIDGNTNNEMELEFDSSVPPPFRLVDIRNAIPKHCWVKDSFRSFSYVVRDLSLVATLIGTAIHLDSWLFYPIYWLLQGTMFWAIFVLGHDW